ncbi:MAG: hypothetical protein OEX14_13680, partial [Paracoccaceae bacterium]|nr:hypothetical protein [Paracoccaceae bacterium]
NHPVPDRNTVSGRTLLASSIEVKKPGHSTRNRCYLWISGEKQPCGGYVSLADAVFKKRQGRKI